MKICNLINHFNKVVASLTCSLNSARLFNAIENSNSNFRIQFDKKLQIPVTNFEPVLSKRNDSVIASTNRSEEVGMLPVVSLSTLTKDYSFYGEILVSFTKWHYCSRIINTLHQLPMQSTKTGNNKVFETLQQLSELSFRVNMKIYNIVLR
jgi:hypothetical protein